MKNPADQNGPPVFICVFLLAQSSQITDSDSDGYSSLRVRSAALPSIDDWTANVLSLAEKGLRAGEMSSGQTASVPGHACEYEVNFSSPARRRTQLMMDDKSDPWQSGKCCPSQKKRVMDIPGECPRFSKVMESTRSHTHGAVEEPFIRQCHSSFDRRATSKVAADESSVDNSSSAHHVSNSLLRGSACKRRIRKSNLPIPPPSSWTVALAVLSVLYISGVSSDVIVPKFTWATQKHYYCAGTLHDLVAAMHCMNTTAYQRHFWM